MSNLEELISALVKCKEIHANFDEMSPVLNFLNGANPSETDRQMDLLDGFFGEYGDDLAATLAKLVDKIGAGQHQHENVSVKITYASGDYPELVLIDMRNPNLGDGSIGKEVIVVADDNPFFLSIRNIYRFHESFEENKQCRCSNKSN